VTLARSLAGSLLLEEGSHSTMPWSMGCHLPLPIALIYQFLISPHTQSQDSLVQDIPSGVLVVLTPLDYLSPHIPYCDSSMVLQLVPFLGWSIVLSITPRCKRIELHQHPSTSVVVHCQHVRLFERGNSRWDRADKRYRIRVDRQVIVEGIVEQGEMMWDIGISLEQTPERELYMRSTLL
jgi:hypothetical protein